MNILRSNEFRYQVVYHLDKVIPFNSSDIQKPGVILAATHFTPPPPTYLTLQSPSPTVHTKQPPNPTYLKTFSSPPLTTTHNHPPPQRTMSSPLSTRRLFHEYQLLCKHSPDGITAGPISEDDIFTWEALIPGPADTPYEGGVFVAEMKFPRDYPLSPPTMRFVGDVWHPNGNPTPPPPQASAPSSFSEPKTKANNLHQSLPHGPRLHQYTARAGGGPAPLRAGVGAVEPDPERGEDLD